MGHTKDQDPLQKGQLDGLHPLTGADQQALLAHGDPTALLLNVKKIHGDPQQTLREPKDLTKSFKTAPIIPNQA
jgi:hypothetical protein